MQWIDYLAKREKNRERLQKTASLKGENLVFYMGKMSMHQINNLDAACEWNNVSQRTRGYEIIVNSNQKGYDKVKDYASERLPRDAYSIKKDIKVEAKTRKTASLKSIEKGHEVEVLTGRYAGQKGIVTYVNLLDSSVGINLESGIKTTALTEDVAHAFDTKAQIPNDYEVGDTINFYMDSVQAGQATGVIKSIDKDLIVTVGEDGTVYKLDDPNDIIQVVSEQPRVMRNTSLKRKAEGEEEVPVTPSDIELSQNQPPDIEEMVGRRTELTTNIDSIEQQLATFRDSLYGAVKGLQEKVKQEEPALVAALEKLEDQQVVIEGWKYFLKHTKETERIKYKDVLTKVAEKAKEIDDTIYNLIQQLKGTAKYITTIPQRTEVKYKRPGSQKVRADVGSTWNKIKEWVTNTFSPLFESLDNDFMELANLLEQVNV